GAATPLGRPRRTEVRLVVEGEVLPRQEDRVGVATLTEPDGGVLVTAGLLVLEGFAWLRVEDALDADRLPVLLHQLHGLHPEGDRPVLCDGDADPDALAVGAEPEAVAV